MLWGIVLGVGEMKRDVEGVVDGSQRRWVEFLAIFGHLFLARRSCWLLTVSVNETGGLQCIMMSEAVW